MRPRIIVIVVVVWLVLGAALWVLSRLGPVDHLRPSARVQNDTNRATAIYRESEGTPTRLTSVSAGKEGAVIGSHFNDETGCSVATYVASTYRVDGRRRMWAVLRDLERDYRPV